MGSPRRHPCLSFPADLRARDARTPKILSASRRRYCSVNRVADGELEICWTGVDLYANAKPVTRGRMPSSSLSPFGLVGVVEDGAVPRRARIRPHGPRSSSPLGRMG